MFQVNDHKDAHWTWEKTGWTQREFQQRVRNVNKRAQQSWRIH